MKFSGDRTRVIRAKVTIHQPNSLEVFMIQAEEPQLVFRKDHVLMIILKGMVGFLNKN